MAATLAFKPMIIGLWQKPKRFISWAARHMMSVLPEPTSWSQMPPPFIVSIQIQSS